jgi:LCP family protein required for cell wall assembly
MPDFHEEDDNPRAREPRRVNPRGSAGSGARGGGSTYAGRSGGPQRGPGSQDRSYNLYRSTPRSIGARLRGETDADLEARASELSRKQPPRPPRGDPSRGRGGRYGGPGGPPPRRGLRRIPGFGPSLRPLWHPLRLLRYLITFCVFWVVLSVVLFFVSASGGNLPGGSATQAALTSGSPMLFSPNNILVVGLDVRPRTGYSSHEAGANYNETNAATDTLMIWRIGGGVSRKLSIPRDTLVRIPDCGAYSGDLMKINAAWACGGPQETIKVVEALTGVKINHMIVVSLGNFVKFIDDIGGVTVKTPRICSNISHGTYVLNLKPGYHHLTGIQAITLARTRENSCNIAYNDFNREKEQQQIMSGIKSQLFSAHAFIHLPWASWDAPKAIQTDMGPVTLLQLFAASEIGGSSPAKTLGGAFGTYNGASVVLNNHAATMRQVQQLLNG